MITNAHDAARDIRDEMLTILPDDDIRRMVLKVFADSIELANEGNLRSWSLATLTAGGMKLQVGPHKLLEIATDKKLYLLLDAASPSPEALNVFQEFKHIQAKEPRDELQLAKVLIPAEDLADILPDALPALHSLILRVRGSVSQKWHHHSQDALQYLIEETGRELPPSPHLTDAEISIQQVRAAMEAAYPESEVRRFLLNMLVDSIELADQGVPESWTLTFLNKKNIRLTVGPNSTFFLGEQEGYEPAPVSFSIASGALSRENAELAEHLKTYTFHRPDGAISITIPVDQPDELLPRFLPAHHSLIEQTRSGKASGGAHMSQEVIEFIESETGRELPKLSMSIPKAWKVSTGDKGTPVKDSLNQRMVGLSLMSHKDVSTLPTTSRDDYMAALPSTDLAPNHGPLQLWMFRSDVSAGDRIYLYYDGAIRGAGTVTGDYYYVEGASYPHRRDVEWQQDAVVPVSKLSTELSDALRHSFMTLEEISIEQADEIDAVIAGDVVVSVMPWQQTYARLFPAAGLHYTPWQQAVFFTALQTKGFVILSGISGTGKTKIAQAFAAALPQPDDGRNVAFLTVRPDWRDSKSLIGYHNPITDQYERTPFLTFLLRAVEGWDQQDGLAWFVILDEMNLAHVEHYFAELLSILESGRDASGWTNEAIQLPVSAGEPELPASMKLPPNLFLIGTVNLDETTHAFSPKVLDRAFAMEFSEVSFDHYSPAMSASGAPLAETERRALLRALSNEGAYPRIDRAAIAALLASDERPRHWLSTLNRQLEPHHMHFAYRVFDEIMAFVDLGLKNGLFADLGSADPLVAAFDAAVLMKVLPKFHGSRARLEGPLVKVLAWCLDPVNPDRAVIENAISLNATPDELEHALSLLPFALPRTAERAARLLWTTYVDGFAAFG